MKIAIPCADKMLTAHFGHCEEFAILEADTEAKTVKDITFLTPPPHEPGLLPKWLGEKQISLVIAGGMGVKAQQLFGSQGIDVITGATAGDPEAVALSYLNGSLQTGSNLCDH